MEVTDRYKLLQELGNAQTIALDTLIAGGTHGEAAETAGVHRVTVSRWVSKHPAFRAELNRRREELLSSAPIVFGRMPLHFRSLPSDSKTTTRRPRFNGSS